MKQHNSFDSLLAECESFAKTLEFGYSSLTQRYEPKALGGFQMAKSDIGNVDRLCLLVRDVMDNEIEKLKALPINSDWRLVTSQQTLRMNSQIRSMQVLAKAIIVELQRSD